MIVISGVLVLVALVLLVIGVVQEALPYVYASIGVSLVSLLFLLLGILQRRREPLPDTAVSGGAAPLPPAQTPVDVSDGVTAVVPSQSGAPTSTRLSEEAPLAASAAEEPASGGTVLVVSGRPRYHVEGCRYLTGKAAEAVDVLDAREEGFTPCGVCRPDDALSGATTADAPTSALDFAPPALASDLDGEAVDEPADGSGDDASADVEPVVEPERPSRRAAARKASTAAATRSGAGGTAAVTAPAVAAPAVAAKAPARKRTAAETATVAAPADRVAKAPAKRAAATTAKTAAAKAPAKTAAARTAAKSAAPSRAAAAAAEGTPAASTARRAGGVVVIPERGRFHKAECRYVRDVDGAEVLTKAQATKQGYEACGVCKP